MCISQFEATREEIFCIFNYLEKPAIPPLVHSRIRHGSHAELKNKMRHNLIKTSEFYFDVGTGSSPKNELGYFGCSYLDPGGVLNLCKETTLTVHLSKGDSTEDAVGGSLCDASPTLG